ncbi:MAG: hypothetical protein JXA24_03885 [Proteobacteria bacterium]|nr:hypothetical protein [Pseudomonadota bacterium]
MFRAPPPSRRARSPVARGGVGEDPPTGIYLPEGDGIGTGRRPVVEPASGEGADDLLRDFDLEFDPADRGPDSEDGRQTLPAPPPEESVLAKLPELEVRWVPFAGREIPWEEKGALSALADSMAAIPLYRNLTREDIERRAEYYHEMWVSIPAEKRFEMTLGLGDHEVLRAGEEAISQSWLIKREAALNARLRLSENPVYRDLPDSAEQRIALRSVAELKAFSRFAEEFPDMVRGEIDGSLDRGEQVTVSIVRDGPGKLVQRAAMAMVSNYHSFEELAYEVFSTEGLEGVMMVHSDRSMVEKLAFRMRRLIEFANLNERMLEMRARTFIGIWQGLSPGVRSKIAYEDIVSRGKALEIDVEPEGAEELEAAKRFREKYGIKTPRGMFLYPGSVPAASIDMPPDSWLSWKRREQFAWEEAERQTGVRQVDSDVCFVHSQLYAEGNLDFVEMLPADRYALSKSISVGFKRVQEDTEFMRRHVNGEGYLSPDGIAEVMRRGGVNDSGMNFRPSRREGLRMPKARDSVKEHHSHTWIVRPVK